MINFQKILNNLEYYDNSKLDLILACRRKAMLAYLYPKAPSEASSVQKAEGEASPEQTPSLGLSTGNNPSAAFGTSIHAAHAAYYSPYHKDRNPEERRRFAYKAFVRKWQTLFAGDEDDKYQMDNGLSILEAYFDNYILEDQDSIPVETEMSFLLEIKPEPGDPPWFVESFWYAGAMDGVFLRIGKDLYADELKTSSFNVDQIMGNQILSRQGRGYVYALKQFSEQPEKVRGFRADVIRVDSKKRDFRREFFYVTETDLKEWRLEVLNIVQDWRTAVLRVNGEKLDKVMGSFYKNTSECFRYWKPCVFHKICQFGTQVIDSSYPARTWTPFNRDN